MQLLLLIKKKKKKKKRKKEARRQIDSGNFQGGGVLSSWILLVFLDFKRIIYFPCIIELEP